MNESVKAMVEYVELLEREVKISKDLDEANQKLINRLYDHIGLLEKKIDELIVENTLLKVVLEKKGES